MLNMIKSYRILVLILLWVFSGCVNPKKEYPDINMSADEIVQAMINAYTVTAAIQLNDASLRDSVSDVYFNQMATFTGRSTEFLRTEFEKLLLMPDSMIVLQNRALDSLRLMQEKSLQIAPVSIGLN
jgi:hypothetical protein